MSPSVGFPLLDCAPPGPVEGNEDPNRGAFHRGSKPDVAVRAYRTARAKLNTVSRDVRHAATSRPRGFGGFIFRYLLFRYLLYAKTASVATPKLRRRPRENRVSR